MLLQDHQVVAKLQTELGQLKLQRVGLISSIESQFSKVSSYRQILQDANIIHEKKIEDFKHRETTLGVKDKDVVAFNASLLSIDHVQELGFLATTTQWLLHAAKPWEATEQEYQWVEHNLHLDLWLVQNSQKRTMEEREYVDLLSKLKVLNEQILETTKQLDNATKHHLVLLNPTLTK